MPRCATVALATMVFLASGNASGQTQPAATPAMAPTYTLDFHDAPADAVLNDIAPRLGMIIVKQYQIPDKISLASPTPVNAQTAALLLNDALWNLGYRVYTSSIPDRTVVRIVRRSDPVEIRTWPTFKPPTYPAQLPADMPGVSTTATLLLRAQNQSLASILDQFAATFGFVIDKLPADLANERMTLEAPMPLTARQAADLVSQLLGLHGRQLQGDTLQDAAGNPHTLLRITPLKKDPSKSASVPFAFEDAPMSIVMAELGKRSGFAIADQTVGVHVTMREVLTVDKDGKADVGPLVAKLNKLLAAQSVVLETSALTSTDGKLVPALSAMPVDMARRTLLTVPPPTEPKLAPASDWIGISDKTTMMMRYENFPVSTVLTNMAQAFGFVIVSEVQLPQRVTIEPLSPVTSAEAVELVNEGLLPLGYTVEAIPSESLKRTILHVMTLTEEQQFERGILGASVPADRPSAQATPAADPPLPPGSDNEIEARMAARRQADLDARRAATAPGQ